MNSETNSKKIVLISSDSEFVASTQAAFSATNAIDLITVQVPLAELQGAAVPEDTGVVIVDLDNAPLESIEAVQRLKRRVQDRIPLVVVVREYDAGTIRILVQLQIADFLVKPVKTADLVRACIHALKGPSHQGYDEAEIYAFVPAAGGVGNTMIALQTAFLLNKSSREAASTCVVDLNFQNGSCAEYLDLQPRFVMSEVESNADRLDHQLLDALLAKHESGLAVLAAPNNPAEQRSFDTDVVMRLLDLVSAYFDNVVLDMPRTWYPWTDAVLKGANHVYVTAEMTVPCIRHTQRMLSAINTQTDGVVKGKVIINRFAAKVTDAAVNSSDAKAVLGDSLAGAISNDYKLVREAVDRGVPLETIDANSSVISDLKRIILPDEANFERDRSKGSMFGFAKPLFKRAS